MSGHRDVHLRASNHRIRRTVTLLPSNNAPNAGPNVQKLKWIRLINDDNETSVMCVGTVVSAYIGPKGPFSKIGSLIDVLQLA